MSNPGFLEKRLKDFLKTESSSGIVLGFVAVLAFLVSNSFFSEFYFAMLGTKVLGLTVHHWINDGLMAIFFFLVGLEIKKELVVGHLSTLEKATFPILAALGGMILPALIYFSLNQSSPTSNGWGIPMATDIAFAIGVLALFGKRIPITLKVFLLAVAIVDDLGAVLVIAFFYTNEIRGVGLGIAFLSLGLILMLRYWAFRSYTIYVLVGAVVWIGFLYSGVHATIAGVLLGLFAPMRFPVERGAKEFYSPIEDLIHKLHPWVSFGIMPVFAFANAGIDLRGVSFSVVALHPVNLGVVFGLLVGKPLGVFLFSYLAVKAKLTSLPPTISWGHILAVGFLAGIGFTMSLFISGLALPVDFEIYSKTGIVLGSIVSGLAGSLTLFVVLMRPNQSNLK